MNTSHAETLEKFSSYQKFIIAVLVFLQFTVILDFMILSPLGAMLIPELQITPSQFGLVVSVYAFSAGLSAILSAGFADRFDRKKLLLFFYVGFIIGTLFCAMAESYHALLIARLVTGLFGGVIGSIVLAIATDIFHPLQRGRVMGFLQTAFSASQVLGIPLGLYLANAISWHSPFYLIVGLASLVGIVIFIRLKPMNAHLNAELKKENPFHHLVHTILNPRYTLGFLTTALLTTGGYMLMPFGSAFTVGNLGISIHSLPTIYLVTGLCSMVTGPLIGRASDAFGRFQVFAFGGALSIVMVLIYTNLGRTPLPWVIAVNAILFVGIFSRIIPSQALMSSLPTKDERGSFMAVSSALQQISGGVSSWVAGHLVATAVDGSLVGYNVIGYVVVVSTLITTVTIYKIQKMIQISGAN